MQKPKVKEDPGVKCRCNFKLTDANYSRVREKYFCPCCCKDYSKEELKHEVPKLRLLDDKNK